MDSSLQRRSKKGRSSRPKSRNSNNKHSGSSFFGTPCFWALLFLGGGTVLLNQRLVLMMKKSQQQQSQLKETEEQLHNGSVQQQKQQQLDPAQEKVPPWQRKQQQLLQSIQVNQNLQGVPPAFPLTQQSLQQQPDQAKLAPRSNQVVRHRVAWMIEGPADYAERWVNRLQNLPDVQLFYHSFDKDCDHCIFNSQTTISSGRNLLLRTALKASQFFYYVFCDYDLIMQCEAFGNNEDSCWQDFVQHLQNQKTRNPVIMPKTWWDKDETVSTFQSCVDGAIKAVRWDYKIMFWPHTTSHDDVALNLNDEFWWHITHRCYPYLILTDHRWRVENPVHKDYPHMFGAAGAPALYDMLNNEYPRLVGEGWDKKMILAHQVYNHRCFVQDAAVTGGKTPDPPPQWKLCRHEFLQRFNAWKSQRGKYVGAF